MKNGENLSCCFFQVMQSSSLHAWCDTWCVYRDGKYGAEEDNTVRHRYLVTLVRFVYKRSVLFRTDRKRSGHFKTEWYGGGDKTMEALLVKCRQMLTIRHDKRCCRCSHIMASPKSGPWLQDRAPITLEGKNTSRRNEELEQFTTLV